jgi:hypothetical protein
MEKLPGVFMLMRMSDILLSLDYDYHGEIKRATNVPAYKCPKCNNTADIETHNTAIRRRLEAIRRERPEEITITRRGGCADSYSFPKKWVKIIPPRMATDKQREHLAQARANIKA